MWNIIGALINASGSDMGVFVGFMIMIWSDLDEQRWAAEKKRNAPND